MKKLLSSLIIITVLVSSLAAFATPSFSDVNENDWFYNNVITLVEMGAINGYPDGTFGPTNPITYAEYLTILVRTTKAGNGNYVAGEGEDWYNAVVQAAYEDNIISHGEVKDFNAPITRADAAEFTEKAVYNVLGEASVTIDGIEKTIKDYDTFKTIDQAGYILHLYSRGIIEGSENGFLPYNNLNRAEAATIILRTVKTENRKDMSQVKIPSDVQPGGGTSQNSSIIIQNGRYKGLINPNYVKELDYQALQSVNFYKENGAHYMSIDLPDLPDGFYWNVYVVGSTKDGTEPFSTYASEKRGIVDKNVVKSDNHITIKIYDRWETGVSMDNIDTYKVSVTIFKNDGTQSLLNHAISSKSPNKTLEYDFRTGESHWIDCPFDTSSLFVW